MNVSKLLPGITIALIGVFLIELVATGSIKIYLNSLFHPIALIGGILLIYIGACYTLKPNTCKQCEMHIPQLLSPIAVFQLLVMTFLVALILSPTGYSSNIIENRGFYEANELVLSIVPLKNLESFESRNGIYELKMTDLIVLGNNLELRNKLQNREVKVNGQILKRANSKEVYLTRFVMFCCAADAKAIGVKITLRDQINFTNMDWVELTGNLKFTNNQGHWQAEIQNAQITQTDAPADPFIDLSQITT